MMAYCAYQDRCHWEVEQKMRDFLLIPEAKDELYLYLIKENYLNEERFVRSYIRGKFVIKHWGRNKIRQHLKQKQIPTKLIEKCWDEINEEDYVQTLKKLYESYGSSQKGNEFSRRQKSIRHLLSKGFEYEIILEFLTDDH